MKGCYIQLEVQKYEIQSVITIKLNQNPTFVPRDWNNGIIYLLCFTKKRYRIIYALAYPAKGQWCLQFISFLLFSFFRAIYLSKCFFTYFREAHSGPSPIAKFNRVGWLTTWELTHFICWFQTGSYFEILTNVWKAIVSQTSYSAIFAIFANSFISLIEMAPYD